APRARRRDAADDRSRAAVPASPVVVEVGLEPGLADLFDEAPAVGPGAVDIGEAVLAREVPRVDRLLVPPGPVGIRRERDNRTPDVPRRLRQPEVRWGGGLGAGARIDGIAPVLFGHAE